MGGFTGRLFPLALVLALAASVCAAPALGAGTLSGSRDPDLMPAAWDGTYRIAGISRYSTASEIAKATYPDGTGTVIVTTADNWADALCASPLAAALDAPILLAPPAGHPELLSLMDATIGRIRSLEATHVIILGGKTAVDEAAEARLRGIGRLEVIERIAGSDRYDTSRRIAGRLRTELGAAWRGTAFVATGRDFPDALGASPIAAASGSAILLTDPNTLPLATRRAITSNGIDSIVILGSRSGVSAAVKDRIAALPGVSSVVRAAGTSRYSTCLKVLDLAIDAGGYNVGQLGVAVGTNYPDALAAGAALARYGQLLLLVPPTRPLPSEVGRWLEDMEGTTTSIVIFGGETAVSTGVGQEIRECLDRDYTAPGILSSVSINIGDPTPRAGTFTTLSAYVKDHRGRALPGASVTVTQYFTSPARGESRWTDITDANGRASGGLAGTYLGHTPTAGVRVNVKVVTSFDGVTITKWTSYTPD